MNGVHVQMLLHEGQEDLTIITPLLLIARLLVTRLMGSCYSYYRLVGSGITEQISYLGVTHS